MARALIFFFACSLLAFQFAFAQQDFRDGYIVTLQYDTVFLKIDYRSRAKSYELCRTKGGSSIKEYSPEELSGYGFVNDKCFESGIIERSFVEVLVRGEPSLYRHGSSYYIKKDETLYHLEQGEIKIEHNAKRDSRWKGLLAFITHDCLSGHEALKKLTFDERSITELIIQYNNCRQSQFTVYKTTKSWTKVEAGIVLGVTRSTLTVDNTKSHDHSVGPSIGLTLAVSSPRVSSRMGLQPEVHVSRADYSLMQVAKGASYTVYEDTYINVTTVSVPLLIRYSFPERKYALKLSAGMNVDLHVKSDARGVREMVGGGVVHTAEEDGLGINKKQLGYVAGLGVMRPFSKFKAGLLLRYTVLGAFSVEPASPTQNRKLSLSMILQMR